MRFWDSSALVPLVLHQPQTAKAQLLASQHREMVVWWGSSIACASAIARLHREHILDFSPERVARTFFREMANNWFEIQPGAGVRDHALRLLRIHALRAADAMQLAAAIEWSGGVSGAKFVTIDDRLGEAASREGFEVL